MAAAAVPGLAEAAVRGWVVKAAPGLAEKGASGWAAAAAVRGWEVKAAGDWPEEGRAVKGVATGAWKAVAAGCTCVGGHSGWEPGSLMVRMERGLVGKRELGLH